MLIAGSETTVKVAVLLALKVVVHPLTVADTTAMLYTPTSGTPAGKVTVLPETVYVTGGTGGAPGPPLTDTV